MIVSVRVRGKLTTRRAVAAGCAACVGAAGVAIFAFGATPLAALLALACVLTMAPAVVVSGAIRREGGGRD
jgi:hypothetical protein